MKPRRVVKSKNALLRGALLPAVVVDLIEAEPEAFDGEVEPLGLIVRPDPPPGPKPGLALPKHIVQQRQAILAARAAADRYRTPYPVVYPDGTIRIRIGRPELISDDMRRILGRAAVYMFTPLDTRQAQIERVARRILKGAQG